MSVDLWRINLDLPEAAIGSLCEVLAPDERERASRYRDRQHQNRFIIGRSATRSILGSQLGIRPAEVSFCYSLRGKPSLPGRDVRFNFSRSGRVALLAVTPDTEVGVDIERINETTDIIGIARHVFAPPEIAALEATPPHEQTIMFFTIWTRKEACVKASGQGISAIAKHFSVWPGALAEGGWHVQSLEIQYGYSAALATLGPSGPIRRLDYRNHFS